MQGIADGVKRLIVDSGRAGACRPGPGRDGPAPLFPSGSIPPTGTYGPLSWHCTGL